MSKSKQTPAPPRKWSAAMVKACRDTIAAYDELIRTGNDEGWERYGDYPKCRLCKACGAHDYFDTDNCLDCAISGGKREGCVTKTMDRLITEIKTGTKASTIGAAKRRRTFIYDRVTKAGIKL